MEKLPSEILDEAADLIAPQGAWTQFKYSNGEQRSPYDADATSFCINGAIQRCAGRDRSDVARRILHRALGTGPTSWNDSHNRTQAEVVAALRQAAELARSEGA